MVKPTNGAGRVGGGTSLMGVSVSPTVSTLGGSASREGKFNLAPGPVEDDSRCKGRNVLWIDGDSH